MGRDKGLLPFQGERLAQFVARQVAEAAGTAVLVGNPERYQGLGYVAIADRYPGDGPLGGILTSLQHSAADWNLVVACDMPAVSAGFLKRILAAAEASEGEALLPVGPSGRPEPLCAVYHRKALAELQQLFDGGERKVTVALAAVRTVRLAIGERAPFENVNTPEDWAGYAAE